METFAKELEDPEQLPLATLQAQLTVLNLENKTLDEEIAQLKKEFLLLVREIDKLRPMRK